MKFSEAVQLLKDTRNSPVILTGRHRGRQVLCAPSLVGRVLTTTFDAASGEALGWIGAETIRKGAVDPMFNNFGGEERFWFGPEGSQFGLHFTSKELTFSHYKVQPGLTSQPYGVVKVSPDNDFVVMKSRMQLRNLAGTQFEVEVERCVRIMEACPYNAGAADRTEFAGFQSESLVTNVSSRAILPETGLLACWTISQQRGGPRSVVVIPFRSGPDSQLGEPIRRDYFKHLCPGGTLPPELWWVGSDHALMRANNTCIAKIGVGPKRATNRLGSINLDTGELVINEFDFYPEMPYVAPYWRHLSPAELLDGEVISVYIHGPDGTGGPVDNFHELETFSPAMPLQPGESFLHRNRVFHLRGDRSTIDAIMRRFLRTSIAGIESGLKGLG